MHDKEWKMPSFDSVAIAQISSFSGLIVYADLFLKMLILLLENYTVNTSKIFKWYLNKTTLFLDNLQLIEIPSRLSSLILKIKHVLNISLLN